MLLLPRPLVLLLLPHLRQVVLQLIRLERVN
jgi:hypothetical protein